MQTLSQIAQKLGVSSQTVRNRIKAYQDDTQVDFYSRGEKKLSDQRNIWYPDDAVNAFILWCGHEDGAQSVDVQVETGNHAITLSDPSIGGTCNLGHLRDSESMNFADPMAIALKFKSAAGKLTEAMDQDIADRMARNRETQQAKELVQKEAQKLEVRQQTYQQMTRLLDGVQNHETDNLRKSVEELQMLMQPAQQ